jgi:hypothetical protein
MHEDKQNQQQQAPQTYGTGTAVQQIITELNEAV